MPKPSKCENCGRLFTPGVILKAEDIKLCDACRSLYKNSADLYCVSCGKFVGKVLCKKLDSGFEIKSGDVLHVTSCPSCSADDSSVILEIEEYDAKRKQSSKDI